MREVADEAEGATNVAYEEVPHGERLTSTSLIIRINVEEETCIKLAVIV